MIYIVLYTYKKFRKKSWQRKIEVFGSVEPKALPIFEKSTVYLRQFLKPKVRIYSVFLPLFVPKISKKRVKICKFGVKFCIFRVKFCK